MNKKTATIIALVAAFVLVLGGTFAWQSISQQALFRAVVAIDNPHRVAGGRLHTDFEHMGINFGEREWTAGVSSNKDIYVENFESVEHGRDIFARVRLYEYMEIGEGARLHPGDPGFATRSATSVIVGAERTDRTTWSPRLPGANADSDHFRRYWDWTFGGQKWFMPTFNQDAGSLESDAKGSAISPRPLRAGEVANATNVGGTHAFPLKLAHMTFST